MVLSKKVTLLALLAVGGVTGVYLAKISQKAPTTIRDLMRDEIDPAADGIWGLAGTVINETGTVRLEPKTPEDWASLLESSRKLAAAARLLLIADIRAAKPGETSYAPGIELEPPQVDQRIRQHRAAFDTFAKEVETLAEEVARLAEARKPETLLDMGEKIQMSCEGCHSFFWYPKDVKGAAKARTPYELAARLRIPVISWVSPDN
jgi:hypothetical protein